MLTKIYCFFRNFFKWNCDELNFNFKMNLFEDTSGCQWFDNRYSVVANTLIIKQCQQYFFINFLLRNIHQNTCCRDCLYPCGSFFYCCVIFRITLRIFLSRPNNRCITFFEFCSTNSTNSMLANVALFHSMHTQINRIIFI